MKKTLLYSILFTQFVLFVVPVKGNTPQSVNLLKHKAPASDVWTNPEGMEFNMNVNATIYKNGAVYEPDGLLLGVFKDADSFCYGYDTWLPNVVGGNTIKLHMVLVMSNDNNIAGYKFKAYNPATNQYFDFNETFSFVPDADYGSINDPKILNIVESAVKENKLDNSLSIFPSIIHGSFSISFINQENLPVKVDLYDLKGSIVSNLFNGYAKNQLDLKRNSSIEKGFYILKITVGSACSLRKVILN